jgi:hypothetical protein
MVNDLVELRREPGVDRRDRLVNRARQVAVEGDGPGERLLDERFDEFLGAIRLGLLGRRNDLFQKPARDSGVGDGRSGVRRGMEIGNGSALPFVEPKFAR